MLETYKDIKQLSCEAFFIEIKPEERITFKSSAFPKNTHVTIAFNKKSTDVNIHLSKNIGNGKDKPKIEIIRISKQDLEQVAIPMGVAFLFAQYDYFEVNVIDFQKGWFIPFDAIQKVEDVHMKLLEHCDDLLSIKKRKKIKVKSEIINRVENYCKEDEFRKVQLSKLKKFCPTCDKGGILFIDDKSYSLLKINGVWYKSNNLPPLELLQRVLGEKFVNYVVDYSKNSMNTIVNLEDYESSKEFNKPLLLYWCYIENRFKYTIKNSPHSNPPTPKQHSNTRPSKQTTGFTPTSNRTTVAHPGPFSTP